MSICLLSDVSDYHTHMGFGHSYAVINGKLKIAFHVPENSLATELILPQNETDSNYTSSDKPSLNNFK